MFLKRIVRVASKYRTFTSDSQAWVKGWEEHLNIINPEKRKGRELTRVEKENRIRMRDAQIDADKRQGYYGMEVVFLGTSGTRPTMKRNCSCTALKIHGDIYLFDCGEGVQSQIMRSERTVPSNVTKIFISHLHGDHVYGLPGFISLWDSIRGERRRSETTKGINKPEAPPLEIYGPEGIGAFLEIFKICNTFNSVPKLRIYELILPDEYRNRAARPYTDYRVQQIHMSEEIPGVWNVLEDEKNIVKATVLPHKPGHPSFAYVVQEKQIPGNIDQVAVTKAGCPPGPLYRDLKDGKTVTLPNGKQLDGKDFIGPPKPGRKVAICYDNHNSSNLVELARGADLMVHEASFEADLAEMAKKKGHSTTRLAAKTAREAGVKALALTHFSSRYGSLYGRPISGVPSINDLVEETKDEFGSNEVIAAHDLMSIPIRQNPPAVGNPVDKKENA